MKHYENGEHTRTPEGSLVPWGPPKAKLPVVLITGYSSSSDEVTAPRMSWKVAALVKARNSVSMNSCVVTL